MLDRKKENNTVCSSINSPSNLVNNVFASVHCLGFNIKLQFSPKIVEVSLTLCQKVVNTAGGIFLPGGENLRSDFDNSKIFQSKQQHFVNTEHQLKSTLA